MRFLTLSLIAALALLLFAPAASPHKIVGRDGKIHACYRVKGKPRGVLRVVRSHKVRCRRGERKVAWAVAAVSGPAGADGAQGAGGFQGDTALATKLTEQVNSLSTRIDGLESTLAGVAKRRPARRDRLAAGDRLALRTERRPDRTGEPPGGGGRRPRARRRAGRPAQNPGPSRTARTVQLSGSLS
jgi:hypothetical protein